MGMTKIKVIYGLTGGPVTNAHKQSYEWLLAQGYDVTVVTAIGHEFKLEALATYLDRLFLCNKVFGEDLLPLEEVVLGLSPTQGPDGLWKGTDLETIRAALKAFGRSVMAIDLMRLVRELNPGAEVRFAIGPDVDVEKWTGIELIRAEFGKDPFVKLPEIPDIRATLVRTNIAAGLPWEHLVPIESARGIKERGLWGYKAP